MKTDWYIRERNFHNPVLHQTEQPVSEHKQDSALCVQTREVSEKYQQGDMPAALPITVLTASIPAVWWVTAAK